jgi:hypothetical protein
MTPEEFEQKCAKVDEITAALSGMAGKLAEATAEEAPFLEVVALSFWRQRAALIREIDGVKA